MLQGWGMDDVPCHYGRKVIRVRNDDGATDDGGKAMRTSHQTSTARAHRPGTPCSLRITSVTLSNSPVSCRLTLEITHFTDIQMISCLALWNHDARRSCLSYLKCRYTTRQTKCGFENLTVAQDPLVKVIHQGWMHMIILNSKGYFRWL